MLEHPFQQALRLLFHRLVDRFLAVPVQFLREVLGHTLQVARYLIPDESKRSLFLSAVAVPGASSLTPTTSALAPGSWRIPKRSVTSRDTSNFLPKSRGFWQWPFLPLKRPPRGRPISPVWRGRRV